VCGGERDNVRRRAGKTQRLCREGTIDRERERERGKEREK